jgi:hypothetical protein
MTETSTTNRPAGLEAYAARGKVTAVKDGVLTFAPSGTNYEMHLASPNDAGQVGALAEGLIHVVARKLWTVPSGGNFVSPIFGSPRTIQGRVRMVSNGTIVVHAGAPFVVDLPTDDAGIGLPNGLITVGAMVNIMAMPGARFVPLAK